MVGAPDCSADNKGQLDEDQVHKIERPEEEPEEYEPPNASSEDHPCGPSGLYLATICSVASGGVGGEMNSIDLILPLNVTRTLIRT